MLNHAEHKLTMEEIEASIKRADEVGLATMVCADSVDQTVIDGWYSTVYEPDYTAA
jgi:triosephosphate isomerase